MSQMPPHLWGSRCGGAADVLRRIHRPSWGNEVKRFVSVRPDPEDDAHLRKQIEVSRERVMRELDAEKQLLASRAA